MLVHATTPRWKREIEEIKHWLRTKYEMEEKDIQLFSEFYRLATRMLYEARRTNPDGIPAREIDKLFGD